MTLSSGGNLDASVIELPPDDNVINAIQHMCSEFWSHVNLESLREKPRIEIINLSIPASKQNSSKVDAKKDGEKHGKCTIFVATFGNVMRSCPTRNFAKNVEQGTLQKTCCISVNFATFRRAI